MLSFISYTNKKFPKGLVTSQNLGSLLLFLRMKGCREEKNFCRFEQHLALKQKYTCFLMGENRQHEPRFFPPKDLVYFSIDQN